MKRQTIIKLLIILIIMEEMKLHLTEEVMELKEKWKQFQS